MNPSGRIQPKITARERDAIETLLRTRDIFTAHQLSGRSWKTLLRIAEAIHAA